MNQQDKQRCWLKVQEIWTGRKRERPLSSVAVLTPVPEAEPVAPPAAGSASKSSLQLLALLEIDSGEES